MAYILNFIISTWYLWAFVLLLGIIRAFRPVIKGFIGEKSVMVYLSRLDKSKKAILLKTINTRAISKTS